MDDDVMIQCLAIGDWLLFDEDATPLPPLVNNWCTQVRNSFNYIAYVSTCIAILLVTIQLLRVRPRDRYGILQFITALISLLCLNAYLTPLVWIDSVRIASHLIILILLTLGTASEAITVAFMINNALRRCIETIANPVADYRPKMMRALRFSQALNIALSLALSIIMICCFMVSGLVTTSPASRIGIVLGTASIAACCIYYAINQIVTTITVIGVIKDAIQCAVYLRARSASFSSPQPSRLSLSYSTDSSPRSTVSSNGSNGSASTTTTTASTIESIDEREIGDDGIVAAYIVVWRKLVLLCVVTTAVLVLAATASVVTAIWPILVTLLIPMQASLAAILSVFYFFTQVSPEASLCDDLASVRRMLPSCLPFHCHHHRPSSNAVDGDSISVASTADSAISNGSLTLSYIINTSQ